MAEDASALLRDLGVRVTAARVAVLEALEAHPHETAEVLAESAPVVAAGVNVASVYRALALFEEHGVARSSRLGESSATTWEAAHPDEHFHVVCTACGDVDHHVGTLVAQIRGHLDEGHGFEVAEVDLTVRGRCSACRGDHTLS